VSKATKSFSFGDQTVTLETGEIARQASAAVLASMGDTQMLATVVGRRQAKPGQDFFPLTINYQEKTYAAGKIPGGFFKREARPNEEEVLTSRLIDRPLRPCWISGWQLHPEPDQVGSCHIRPAADSRRHHRRGVDGGVRSEPAL